MNKIYKIVYKMEYTFTEEEVKVLDGIDNVIQECIDQDSSEHSDKSNWIVEEVQYNFNIIREIIQLRYII